MTVTTGGPDVAAVVGALSDANVQFVVVGEPTAGDPLRIVVSSHPTNLQALGRALDRLESTMRTPEAGQDGEAQEDPPRRIGDPMGTISVATSAGDIDLIFGGPRRSLYAEVAPHAEERAIGGLRVQWVATLPSPVPVPRTTSRILGRRLMSLAEGLTHLIERHDDEPSTDGELNPDA